MSLWERMKAWWIFGKNSGHRGSKRVYIVDAARLASSGGGRGGRLSPRAQLGILQRLSRFAKKENIQVCAVFDGRPLREAADGKRYQDVAVYYAKKAANVPDRVIDVLKDVSRRRDVMVITSDRQLEERVMVHGATTMRTSTFRKAMEATIGAARESSSRSSSRRRRGRRRPPRSKSSSGEKKSQKQESADPVRELIDLVE